jgi:hypothetical protein
MRRRSPAGCTSVRPTGGERSSATPPDAVEAGAQLRDTGAGTTAGERAASGRAWHRRRPRVARLYRSRRPAYAFELGSQCAADPTSLRRSPRARRVLHQPREKERFPLMMRRTGTRLGVLGAAWVALIAAASCSSEDPSGWQRRLRRGRAGRRVAAARRAAPAARTPAAAASSIPARASSATRASSARRASACRAARRATPAPGA